MAQHDLGIQHRGVVEHVGAVVDHGVELVDGGQERELLRRGLLDRGRELAERLPVSLEVGFFSNPRDVGTVSSTHATLPRCTATLIDIG